VAASWADCRFLTCSVLPVRVACNLRCPFCFSKASISALSSERVHWKGLDLDAYYRFARERGARRLVITGGGEPLLRPDEVVWMVERGRSHFDEIALFTNASLLTPALSERLQEAGLSYLCWSRHHEDDAHNRELMGGPAPGLDQVLHAAGDLTIRATCVMTRGAVDSQETAWRYVRALAARGIRQFTLKHTYTAYESSVFRGSSTDRWAEEHQVELDPFANTGRILGRLPWGPEIRQIDGLQVCWYHEPTPRWEQENKLCRSSNLLSDGAVYASLEDEQSLLYRLTG
jgi:MoaA/NifB/PqqE/SkfB family radical SAM enzyme